MILNGMRGCEMFFELKK